MTLHFSAKQWCNFFIKQFVADSPTRLLAKMTGRQLLEPYFSLRLEALILVP